MVQAGFLAPAPFLDTHESLVARGDLSNVDVPKRIARMMVRPALRYIHTRIFDKCAKQVPCSRRRASWTLVMRQP